MNILKTPDLGLSALLRYLGHSPVNVENTKGKVFFVFPDTEETRKVFNGFELGLKVEVEPARLFQTLKDTKGMIMRRMNYER